MPTETSRLRRLDHRSQLKLPTELQMSSTTMHLLWQCCSVVMKTLKLSLAGSTFLRCGGCGGARAATYEEFAEDVERGVDVAGDIRIPGEEHAQVDPPPPGSQQRPPQEPGRVEVTRGQGGERGLDAVAAFEPRHVGLEHLHDDSAVDRGGGRALVQPVDLAGGHLERALHHVREVADSGATQANVEVVEAAVAAQRLAGGLLGHVHRTAERDVVVDDEHLLVVAEGHRAHGEAALPKGVEDEHLDAVLLQLVLEEGGEVERPDLTEGW
ncbi:uncharacterized protein BcabD6B2_40970 [Babesia caballi]|uniref:Related to double-strand-break repair protein rad21 n=1 Tax=Babesia caballi TaxID=5871 RepID=A0AAV4LYH2_BABCB|nr:related to double-strand-break repair protein rad21 [Babesia caballi]